MAIGRLNAALPLDTHKSMSSKEVPPSRVASVEAGHVYPMIIHEAIEDLKRDVAIVL